MKDRFKLQYKNDILSLELLREILIMLSEDKENLSDEMKSKIEVYKSRIAKIIKQSRLELDKISGPRNSEGSE